MDNGKHLGRQLFVTFLANSCPCQKQSIQCKILLELCPKTVCVDGSQFPLSRGEAEDLFAATAEYSEGPAMDSSVDKWHYIHLCKL